MTSLELKAHRFGVLTSSTFSPSTVLLGSGHTIGEALLCSSKELSRYHLIALEAVCLASASQFEQLIQPAPYSGNIWGYWLCDETGMSLRTL